MQLAFLGKTYQASFPPVEATTMEENGLFLGQPYAMKQYPMMPSLATPARLVYRGVHYLR